MMTNGRSWPRLGLLWLVCATPADLLAQAAPEPTVAPPEAPTRPAVADPELQLLVENELEVMIRTHGLPAMSLRIVREGRVLASATRGVRALGEDALAAEGDLWHIAACGRLFTAALIARLVDRGVLTFDLRLEDALPPEMVSAMHVDLRRVTLEQLLSHTAGIDDQALRDEDLRAAIERFQETANDEIRACYQVASAALAAPPRNPPGSAFFESNHGYVVVAAIASHATGRPWRELLRDYVCEPLKIERYGFGAPGTDVPIDAPRGHQGEGSELRPLAPSDPSSDNPSYLDPAGRMHITFDDWQRFLEMVIAGAEHRSDFLSESSFERLFTPLAVEGANSFALGITLVDEPEREVRSLVHDGSNTLFRAEFRYEMQSKRLLLMATNCGNEAAAEAFRRVTEAIRNEFEIRASRAGK